MTAERRRFGQAGEEAAQAFLRKKKYRILETNFRTPSGEIDIIAEHKGVLVFVEVKARSGKTFGAPEEAVTPTKQKKLVQTARQFLLQRNLEGRPCRFDVVSLLGSPDRPEDWTLELLEDAFRP